MNSDTPKCFFSKVTNQFRKCVTVAILRLIGIKESKQKKNILTRSNDEFSEALNSATISECVSDGPRGGIILVKFFVKMAKTSKYVDWASLGIAESIKFQEVRCE